MSEVAVRHVLITGGEGGLGKALAAAFTDAGWTAHAPGRTELDVTNAEMVDTQIARLPRLDALVANAGLIRDGALATMTAEDFSAVVEVNLRGAFLLARAALRRMVAQRHGHLIWIGSRVGRRGARGQANYAAAKAGLIAFSQSIAKEYGKRNIRSNVILPGYLPTKMNRHLPPATVEAIREEHQLGRFNTPEEAARFTAFLASTEHISGQVFQLDSRIDPWG